MLVHRAGSAELPVQQLAWVNRSGTPIESLGAPGDYNHVELSPGGRQVAVDLIDPQAKRSDIWILDASTGAPRRFTLDPGIFVHARWSQPDGARVLFAAQQGGGGRLGFH